MPWNGSGQFNRTNGVFTGATVWDESRVAGRTVRTDDHDTHDEDIATGLENTVTRDGQNQPSANLSMGGFRHTNVDDAAARNDYAAAGQIQDQDLSHVPPASVGGTGDAITLSPSPVITTYTAGQRFSFVAENDNTGAVTVNVSSLGTRAIQKTGSVLVSGDITTGDLIDITYDGTQFQMVSPSAALAFTNQANTFTDSQTIDRGNQIAAINLDSDRIAAGTIGGAVTFLWDGTVIGQVRGRTGDDTTNKDEGDIIISTAAGGVETTRVSIHQEGGVEIGSPTGGQQGAETLNATELYEAGNRVAVQAQANTFTATQTIDGSASPGELNLLSSKTSGNVGILDFIGHDSAANDTVYGRIASVPVDTTNGSEDGYVVIQAVRAGAEFQDVMRFGSGGVFTPGASGGDQGTNTINASGYYQNGTQIAVATQAEMEAASSTSVNDLVTPGRVQNHPGVAKAWVSFTVTAGSPSIDTDYNVTSITDNGAGDFTINFDTNFSSANYVVTGGGDRGTNADFMLAAQSGGRAAGSCAVNTFVASVFTIQDPATAWAVFFGDQ